MRWYCLRHTPELADALINLIRKKGCHNRMYVSVIVVGRYCCDEDLTITAEAISFQPKPELWTASFTVSSLGNMQRYL